jgi:hypothetical protein
MYSSFSGPIRRLLIACAVITFAMTFSHSAKAQSCGGLNPPPIEHSNSGYEFLVCFLANETEFNDTSPNEFQNIFFAAVDTTIIDTVTITCKAYPKLKRSFYLKTGSSSAVWDVTSDPTIAPWPPNDGVINSDEEVDQKVFVVTATSPIICYGINNKILTADAFLAIPKNVSTGDYRILTYPNSNTGLAFASPADQHQTSEFCVAAFENNTIVHITPSAITKNGTLKNQEVIFKLDSGECVQVKAAPDEPLADMTGSVISTEHGKPVAVYAGHSRACSPPEFIRSDLGASRDHLAEAMPPISTWGASYITKNFGTAGRNVGDTMRILARENNTVIKINGKVWNPPLNANEFRDTGIAFDPNNPLNNIATVETDGSTPILVGMIAHSAIIPNGEGDPFLAIVPSLNQSYNDFTYFITPSNQYTGHNLIVVAEKIADSIKIAIDGILQPQQSYTILPELVANKKYAVATIQQQTGVHHIVGTTKFSILAFGFGPLISYGYTAGSLFITRSGIMSVQSPDHMIAPNPGKHVFVPPNIQIRNISYEKLYFDSAKITYTQNISNNVVKLKKDIALQTGTIEVGEEKTLELTTANPIEDVITGNIQIFYHSANWVDLIPADIAFTITPQQQAGVNDISQQAIMLENYPNPSTGNTTVHFRIPSRAFVAVKIYDALGRTVRTVMQSVSSGEENLQVSTKGMTPGDYILELLAPSLGISKHSHVIVIE